MDTTQNSNTKEISPQEKAQMFAEANKKWSRGRTWQPTALDAKLNRGSALMFLGALQTPLPPEDQPRTGMGENALYTEVPVFKQIQDPNGRLMDAFDAMRQAEGYGPMVKTPSGGQPADPAKKAAMDAARAKAGVIPPTQTQAP